MQATVTIKLTVDVDKGTEAEAIAGVLESFADTMTDKYPGCLLKMDDPVVGDITLVAFEKVD